MSWVHLRELNEGESQRVSLKVNLIYLNGISRARQKKSKAWV
jgi:hypothetical protein